MNRTQERQIRAALGLLEPMGEVIEKMHEVILAHHPAGFDADDCPVCSAFTTELGPILDRWNDARARVQEHWDV